MLPKRSYLTKELCTRVVEAPLRVERQESNRYRFWGKVPELEGKYLRVVTLDDKVTIHNAFLGQAVQAMKVHYHPETDSLYIDLSEQASVESREVSEGVVLDYDVSGNLVGIDIDNASNKVELHRFVISQIPAPIETIAG